MYNKYYRLIMEYIFKVIISILKLRYLGSISLINY